MSKSGQGNSEKLRFYGATVEKQCQRNVVTERRDRGWASLATSGLLSV